MRPLMRTSCLLLVLTLSIAVAGCSEGTSPASPSSLGASTGQLGGTEAVGLTGLVSSLNPEARNFSLVVRGGTRLVVADAETVVWSQTANSQVRFSALRDGQVVSIRGIDHTRYVLAKSIVITR